MASGWKVGLKNWHIMGSLEMPVSQHVHDEKMPTLRTHTQRDEIQTPSPRGLRCGATSSIFHPKWVCPSWATGAALCDSRVKGGYSWCWNRKLFVGHTIPFDNTFCSFSKEWRLCLPKPHPSEGVAPVSRHSQYVHVKVLTADGGTTERYRLCKCQCVWHCLHIDVPSSCFFFYLRLMSRVKANLIFIITLFSRASVVCPELMADSCVQAPKTPQVFTC